MKETRGANRLASETSPYLLQHACNPVDWYPWGEEAFEKARCEDKPIFLSIGYSACHWCHVMERESFENETIAALMNESFVNIKVDREERPDLDSIYMNFVQATTGSGGWPMSVFLTAEGLPFHGGTYFPPEDSYGRPGFKRILQIIAHYYRDRRGELLENRAEIIETLRKMGDLPESRGVLNENLFHNAHRSLEQRFDPIQGGFGGAPKFPPSMNILFLLRYHLRQRESRALKMAEHSLIKMAEGGIYDQLGGGFHRYSVDDHWLVPHFEKMLYDNALLVRAYLEAYQLTGKSCHRQVVEETLGYVLREMTDSEGGFYSAQDADSEGEEGKFFVWSAEEIEKLLDPDKAVVLGRYYGVTRAGNFEGHNILHVASSVANLARELGRPEDEIGRILQECRHRLREEREKRVHPQTDTKILTAWNGLMLTAFAEAYSVLRDPLYKETAERNAGFLLSRLRREGKLLRSYRDGETRLNGYLEDYAQLMEGLISLYQATFQERWLQEAEALAKIMIEEFWEEQDQAFFFTGRSHEKLLVRPKDYYDNATPSGNSSATLALLKLSQLTGKPEYRSCAEKVLRRMTQALVQLPAVFAYQLCALDWYLARVPEFCVVAQEDQAEEMLRTIHSRFIPNKVVAGKSPGAPSALPLLEGRTSLQDRPTLYICENFTCKEPVIDQQELVRQLDQLMA